VTPQQQRLIDDRLWYLIQPLLPTRPRPRGPGGWPRIDDRAALDAILFVLRTGCRWRDLPPQLGFRSGHTAWRRLRAWQEAGVWDRLHRIILEEPSEAQLLDWSRLCRRGVGAGEKGGELTGRTPPTEAHEPTVILPAITGKAVGPR
jgi:transposase